jgi:hypothetical protein
MKAERVFEEEPRFWKKAQSLGKNPRAWPIVIADARRSLIIQIVDNMRFMFHG